MAKRSDRVDWLRKHPDVVGQTRLQVIKRMKAAKLLSVKTVSLDVNLFNLMRDAGYSRRDCAKFSMAPFIQGAIRYK